MGKYSSDSETDKRGGKSYSSRNKRRSTSSSSDSSKSKYRRDKKYKRRSRSKSRDKYSRSRRSRSSSVSTYHSSTKSKYCRSSSKEKSKYKKSPSREKRRSHSRDRFRSRRSRSKSYIREYASKPKNRSDSSESSSSESNQSNPKNIITRDKKKTHTDSSGLPLKQSKNFDYLPNCTITDNKVIAEINEDKFAPKKFISSGKSKKDEKIVIDLKKQTIKIPKVEPIEPDSIFHHNLFLNEESRMDKWVKELYSYRQKSLQQGQKNCKHL
ncbi:unnamed protein product, partial [Brassicogethes aeneus]